MFEEFQPKVKIGALKPLAVIDNAAYEFYRIAPPDILVITVRPEPQIERELTVRPDGRISLDLIGDVPSDASVRDAVRRRQLLAECFPGSPAAQAVAAVAAKMGHARK
mgnify:CR=1 FL=1